jgi:hypothetical protein
MSALYTEGMIMHFSTKRHANLPLSITEYSMKHFQQLFTSANPTVDSLLDSVPLPAYIKPWLHLQLTTHCEIHISANLTQIGGKYSVSPTVIFPQHSTEYIYDS